MRVLATFVLAITLSFANAQKNDAIQKFFQNYSNDESFTSVNITGKVFEMISKIQTTDPEFADFQKAFKNIKYVNILTHEGDGNKLYKEAIAKVNTTEYEPLMVVKGKDENVQFLTKTTGNTINELLLLVGDEKDFTLLSFVGDLDLDMISKMSTKVDLNHGDTLKALNGAKKGK